MIWGSGPGRGVPWWRWHRARVLRWIPVQAEPAGLVREGRLIVTVGNR